MATADTDRTTVEAVPWSAGAGAYFLRRHRQGQHVAIVGPTGSGKSRLGLTLCQLIATRTDPHTRRPERVAILADKPRDATVSALNWPKLDEWPPGYGKEHGVVWPKYGDPETAAERQAKVFRRVLRAAFSEGHQTLYIDEVAYFEAKPPDGLGLKPLVHNIWTRGRALELTLIAATQRPVEVGRAMWSEPEWLFAFHIDDYDYAKRVGEFGDRKHLLDVLDSLGSHEFVVVHRPRGGHRRMFVSKLGT